MIQFNNIVKACDLRLLYTIKFSVSPNLTGTLWSTNREIQCTKYKKTDDPVHR